MSVSNTTTLTKSQAQTQTSSNVALLADYQIYHSDPNSSDPSTEVSRPHIEQSPAETNPPEWQSNYRRVPDYRPVNRHLDYSERPAGLNGTEYVFIQTMLQGVRLIGNTNTLWRNTAGRINNRLFHYKIGGEF